MIEGMQTWVMEGVLREGGLCRPIYANLYVHRFASGLSPAVNLCWLMLGHRNSLRSPGSIPGAIVIGPSRFPLNMRQAPPFTPSGTPFRHPWTRYILGYYEAPMSCTNATAGKKPQAAASRQRWHLPYLTSRMWQADKSNDMHRESLCC